MEWAAASFEAEEEGRPMIDLVEKPLSLFLHAYSLWDGWHKERRLSKLEATVAAERMLGLLRELCNVYSLATTRGVNEPGFPQRKSLLENMAMICSDLEKHVSAYKFLKNDPWYSVIGRLKKQILAWIKDLNEQAPPCFHVSHMGLTKE